MTNIKQIVLTSVKGINKKERARPKAREKKNRIRIECSIILRRICSLFFAETVASRTVYGRCGATGTRSRAKIYDKRVVRIENSSFCLYVIRDRPTSRRARFVSGAAVVRRVNIVTTANEILFNDPLRKYISSESGSVFFFVYLWTV